MIKAIRAVPERVVPRNKIDGRRKKRAGVAERRKSIRSREVAGDIHRHEEIVGFERIYGPNRGAKQSFMESNFGGKEMRRAAGIREPYSIELRREIVYVDLEREGRRRGEEEERGGGGRGDEEVEREGEPEDPTVVFFEAFLIKVRFFMGVAAIEEVLHLCGGFGGLMEGRGGGFGHKRGIFVEFW